MLSDAGRNMIIQISMSLDGYIYRIRWEPSPH
jgi:hypothetical protein